MPNNNPQAPTLELGSRPKAGDVSTFSGGRVSYLSPLPLPTGLPARDYAHAVGEVNDTYMDFGTGLPNVFAWQATLGGPFTFWIMSVGLMPVLILLGTPLLGGSLTVAKEMAIGFFESVVVIGSIVGLSTLAIGLGIWLNE